MPVDEQAEPFSPPEPTILIKTPPRVPKPRLSEPRRQEAEPPQEEPQVPRLGGPRLPRTEQLAPVARRVTIGLDFGTSSSKCILNLEEESNGKGSFFVVTHDHPVPTYGQLLFPSTVSSKDGCLYFGHDAERLQTTSKIRSFKMCLPCQCRNRADEASCPRCLQARPGWFEFEGEQFSAEDLSTLYLAKLIQHAEEAARNLLPGKDLKVWINSAAPLDQMADHDNLKTIFERCVYYAMKLSRSARQVWPVGEATLALRRVREEPMPHEKDSPTSIVPETHAAMVAYILQPGREHGLHATVDVGAGTTDVTFFWLGNAISNAALPEAYYYAAASTFWGMDDVDREMGLASGSNDDPRKLRLDLTPRRLQRLLPDIEHVLDEIFTHYKRVFGKAYEKEKNMQSWRDENHTARYRLCLVGGGVCFKPMSYKLKATPNTLLRSVPCEVLEIPKSVQATNVRGKRFALEDGEKGLLLIAFGLAHRRVDIVAWSNQETPRRCAVRYAERPTHEEIYGV